MIWYNAELKLDLVDFRHLHDSIAAPTAFVNSKDELVMNFSRLFAIGNNEWDLVRDNTDEFVEFFEILMPIVKEMRVRPILDVLKEHEWKSVTT